MSAVVIDVASCGGLGVVRQGLLRLRADRDFVLRGRGLGCSLCRRLGWLCCGLRLGLSVNCLG